MVKALLKFSFFCDFTGIQRPLKDICELTQSIYIPKGINTPSLDKHTKWDFEPQNVRVSTDKPSKTVDTNFVFWEYIIATCLTPYLIVVFMHT